MKNGQALEQWARREVAALQDANGKIPDKLKRPLILLVMKGYQAGAIDTLDDAVKGKLVL